MNHQDLHNKGFLRERNGTEKLAICPSGDGKGVVSATSFLKSPSLSET